ncbi:hypothetical protein Q31b_01440 [Novipirellula aureliae]|uniref:Uncharacterized protein n=1 Tax=Novipirellula aureliae TaxID=2527966 RepID=A0A5C6E5M7_9BACT|nr:hypothetical protein Q31b_01440 [Novipirellula aureliae]
MESPSGHYGLYPLGQKRIDRGGGGSLTVASNSLARLPSPATVIERRNSPIITFPGGSLGKRFWCIICAQGANYGELAAQCVLARHDRYVSLGRFAMLEGTDYSVRTDFPNRKRGFSDTESLDVASYTSC